MFYGGERSTRRRSAVAQTRKDRASARAPRPFGYGYMVNAMWVSALVGGVCAFLSAYLMLKGWSLMGDALAPLHRAGRRRRLHARRCPSRSAPSSRAGSRPPAMLFVNQQTRLREDAVIGLDLHRLLRRSACSWSSICADVGEHPDHRAGQHPRHLRPRTRCRSRSSRASRSPSCCCNWKDLMVDLLRREPRPHHRPQPRRAEDRCSSRCCAACTVAALQTVGAFLVIAMVVTPGATAYLLTDRFGRLIVDQRCARRARPALSAPMSAISSMAPPAASSSSLQTLMFLAAFLFAPKHGLLAARRRPQASWRRPHETADRLDHRAAQPIPFMQRALIVSVLVARGLRGAVLLSWCSRAGR